MLTEPQAKKTRTPKQIPRKALSALTIETDIGASTTHKAGITSLQLKERERDKDGKLKKCVLDITNKIFPLKSNTINWNGFQIYYQRQWGNVFS